MTVSTKDDQPAESGGMHTPVLSASEHTAMCDYRLTRFRAEMTAADVDLAVLSNPLSTRYVTDVWQFPVFQARLPVHYIVVPIEGPIVNFGGFLNNGSHIIAETRPGRDTSVFLGGFAIADHVAALVQDVLDFAREISVTPKRVSVENMSPHVALAFADAGCSVIDGQYLIDRATLIKSAEEIKCMRRAVAIVKQAMHELVDTLRPGLSEREVWGDLIGRCIANGAEWFDSHQLVSGPRTNPPGQEAEHRLIEDGDLVAYDTDMIGPFGYCADVSRTHHCGPSKPTAEQRDLYKRAHAQLLHDRELLRPSTSFRDISERGYRVGDGYQQFACIAHGLGMGDEYPFIRVADHPQGLAYDGEIEPGMVMCVEAYAGRVGGCQGVKLEDQLLITDDGYEVLSHFPFEDELLV